MTAPPAPADPAPAAPPTAGALFRGFLRVGLLGFGGVAAQARFAVVERHGWLSEAGYAEVLGLCQALPGPNVCNASIMIGDRFAGVRGALAAVTGLMAAPLLVLLALAAAHERYGALPRVAGAVEGMGVAAAGVILGTGLRMGLRLGAGPAALLVAAGCFAAVALARLPLLPVVAAAALAAHLIERPAPKRPPPERPPPEPPRD